jgi:hypothetical protein
MTMQDYELDAYLGDDVTVTDEQRQRLLAEADRIAERYPDPDDQEERDTAFAVAVAYVLGDDTLDSVGRRVRAGRRALIEARQIAVMAIEDGASEASAARDLGVDRMTIRKWRGKR